MLWNVSLNSFKLQFQEVQVNCLSLTEPLPLILFGERCSYQHPKTRKELIFVGYNTVKILDDDLTYETITENIDLTEALKFSTEEESKDFIDYVSLSEKERRVSDVKEKLNEKGKEAEHLYKELQRLREGNEEDKNSNNSPDQNIFNFPW
jgi:hypothetical protein